MTPPLYPAVPQHPLAPPSLSGNTVSVDLMLNQYTRVTQMIMDLTLQRFIADRVFSTTGGVTGGAVVYDIATMNQLYLSRDWQRVSPGGEFPLVTNQRLAPGIAPVEKWGAKTFITDEARDRNNAAYFTQQIRQMGNTIVRKINQRVVDTLNAAVTAYSQTAVGRNWQSVITAGTSASSAQQYPARDFALAQQLADQQELGITYDLWLMNPQEYAQLLTIYGNALPMVLEGFNISLYSTNRVPAGTAYAVAQGQVGEMRLEKPLGTTTWRDEEREITWVQSSVRPVFFVNNPYAVIKFTGLAG